MSWSWHPFGEHLPGYRVLGEEDVPGQPETYDRYVAGRRGLAGGHPHEGWSGPETRVRVYRPAGDPPGSPRERIIR
ncbi:MAG TPA: hypothetical protein VLB73_01355 [Patescibacteria group bacterium]|nr:hypothetical protein [Patescibacteria group bacterium]